MIYVVLYRTSLFIIQLIDLHVWPADTLLMKHRLGLRHETLAVLSGLYDRKTVSNVLQSARVALMKDFVPQHLGFEHISRRTLIDQ